MLSLLLAGGLLLEGKAVYVKRCAGCHAADEHRMGPRLRGVFGRRAGTADGYPYSDALKAVRAVWDAKTLDKWLADPDALVPGNDMSFRVEKPEERMAIIEYLRNLK